uniref:Uncharacterized protein n=1 Tax=Fagus sylvatica TaxID=28930 RepID=A0A2N9H5F9_FAGSY
MATMAKNNSSSSSSVCHHSPPASPPTMVEDFGSLSLGSLRHPWLEQELELPHGLILTLTEVLDLAKAPSPELDSHHGHGQELSSSHPLILIAPNLTGLMMAPLVVSLAREAPISSRQAVVWGAVPLCVMWHILESSCFLGDSAFAVSAQVDFASHASCSE